MARLYKRKRSPYWWAEGYNAEGQRWRESTKTADKRTAEKVAKRIERRHLLADPRRPELKLSDALDLLRKHKERQSRSAATMQILAEKGGRLLATFGSERDVNTLTLADAEGYVDARLAEGVSLHTIHKEWGTLRAALRQARRHKLYMDDPADIWPDTLRDVYRPRKRWLSLEEYRRILVALPVRRRDHLVMYCHTGVRHSELYTIALADIDPSARTMKVHGTKGSEEARVRTIPLSADAWRVVEKRLRHSSPRLFPDRWERSTMARTLKARSKKAGIPKVDSANDLRRTFATWLLHAGVPEATTIKLMGHTSSAMVRRVYAQHSGDLLREAIDRLPSLHTGPVLCTNSVREGKQNTDSEALNGRHNR